MFTADEMLRTTPGRELTNERALTDCIEACFACAQSCTACADACLDEDDVATLRQCIRLDLDCAGLCALTGQTLSRRVEPGSELLRRQLELLGDVAAACAEECARHGDHHPHCRVCAEACRRCESACRELVGELGAERPALH
jgi:hypothetical protein